MPPLPTKTQAGAFELLGITGVSLARGADVLGIRMTYPHVSLGLFDDKYAILSLDRPAAHAPDLSYVRYSWRLPTTPAGLRKVAGWPWKSTNTPPVFDLAAGEAVRVTLEWRFDGQTVTGRYGADGPVRVGLMINGCFQHGEIVSATSDACRLALGDSLLRLRFGGPVREPYRIDTRLQAWAGLIEPNGKAMALYPVELAAAAPMHFAMTLGPADPPLDAQETDRELAAGADAYEARRMRSTGICPGGAEALAALSGYSRAYDPRRRAVQTTVNRTWGGHNVPGLIFGWDNFFDSYIAAWEDPALGAASLEHIVGVYGENGENGIARGPVQRNLIIPMVYCRTLAVLGDEDLARRTWPTMMAFMRFWFSDRGDGHPWRDGNDDGLIELGSNEDAARWPPGYIIQGAMDETGYDESPVVSAGFTEGRLGMPADGVEFDWHRRTLTITTVGQNSLYCAACEAMAVWADRLGKPEDAQWLRAEDLRVAGRMQEMLYCQADRIFRNRYWHGGFSPVKAMTTFFPLLAGIADEPTRDALKQMLLDPKQFWGENVCPTVSRDDPAYCDGLDGRGNYWRGNCWPPTTYMVYLSIKQAGWDDVAADYASRACRMFLEPWNRHGHAYENFPAEGPADRPFLYVQPWGGREVRYVWSGMMLLCGLEEAFGPEMTRPGVRFGNPHLEDETAWRGFRFAGQTVDAVAGKERTRVTCGDLWQFSAEPGLAVRGFQQTAGGFRFSAAAEQAVTVRIEAASMGDAEVRVDGKPVQAAQEGGAVTFALPSGPHEVRIARQ